MGRIVLQLLIKLHQNKSKYSALNTCKCKDRLLLVKDYHNFTLAILYDALHSPWDVEITFSGVRDIKYSYFNSILKSRNVQCCILFAYFSIFEVAFLLFLLEKEF